jgi:2,4-dienoyl-CoA reductase-like NADH-dependent reductase (Old Yellow Enzyme family)
MKEKGSKINPLFRTINIGTRTAINRIALNAMECNDGDKNGNPTELNYTRYEMNFRGNAGVIFMEAISVIDESRGRLNQLLGMDYNLRDLTKFVSQMRKINDKPLLLIQLTHSGELSDPDFSRRVCVKPLPEYGGDLLSEENVEEIINRFVLSAKIAHDCGADGIDFKLCHGYLGSQFLRPCNDRKWKYGGPWENRTRFAYGVYERINREIDDPDFIVGSKISVWEGFPGGMGTAGPDTPVLDLSEPCKLAKGLEERGAQYILVSAGNPSKTLALTQPDRDIPDHAYLHFTFQKAIHDAVKPETAVIGSAYSVFRNGKNKFLAVNRDESSLVYWGNKNIRDGVCDMIAIGRQSLADPELPLKLKSGREEKIHWFTTYDNCIEFLTRQQPVGCATYDRKYARALQDIRRAEGRLKEKHT